MGAPQPNSPLKNREPGVRPPAKGGASDPVRLPNLCFSTGCSARHDTSLQRIRSLVPFFAGPVPGQSSRIGASHCDGDTRAAGGEDDRDGERNSLQIAELDDDVRRGAKGSSSGRGGIRTHTPLTGYGILSPVRLPVPPLGRQRAALRWAGGVRKAEGCLVPRS